MQMIRDDNWVLSVGTFLPILGVIALLLVPKGKDQAVKTITLVTAIATAAVVGILLNAIFLIFKPENGDK